MGSVSENYRCPLCGRTGMGGYSLDSIGFPICTEGKHNCLGKFDSSGTRGVATLSAEDVVGEALGKIIGGVRAFEQCPSLLHHVASFLPVVCGMQSASCLRQSSPKLQRGQVIHVLDLACAFLPQRKWCRELSKLSCKFFGMRTRVVLWNNDAAGLNVEGLLKELLEEIPDSLKLLGDHSRPEHCSSCSHTATYEIELFVYGVHRVCLHKVVIWGCKISCSFLGMPISLFQHLRSTGCFKEQLLHCHTRVVDDYFVPVVRGNNHRNI